MSLSLEALLKPSCIQSGLKLQCGCGNYFFLLFLIWISSPNYAGCLRYFPFCAYFDRVKLAKGFKVIIQIRCCQVSIVCQANQPFIQVAPREGTDKKEHGPQLARCT
jgi:hypothetical protein